MESVKQSRGSLHFRSSKGPRRAWAAAVTGGYFDFRGPQRAPLTSRMLSIANTTGWNQALRQGGVSCLPRSIICLRAGQIYTEFRKHVVSGRRHTPRVE